MTAACHSSSLRKALAAGQTFVLDGGLATELERKGCDISGSLWSAEILINEPELIEQVHLDYFKHGAEFAITASYQASVLGLMQHASGMTEDQAMALIQRSVQLARNAIDSAKTQGVFGQLFVAGSVGPYGAFLADGSEYTGNYSLSAQDMQNFHRPRIQALIDAGVDVLAIETIPSYAETAALVHVLREFPAMNAWVSFTLKDETHISDGTSLSRIVDLLNEEDQIIAIGINCVSEDLAEKSLEVLHELTSKPLVVYPNSGEVYDASTKTWSGKGSGGSSLQEKARRWQSLGARLVGGCCRTTPESIRTIRDSLK